MAWEDSAWVSIRSLEDNWLRMIQYSTNASKRQSLVLLSMSSTRVRTTRGTFMYILHSVESLSFSHGLEGGKFDLHMVWYNLPTANEWMNEWYIRRRQIRCITHATYTCSWDFSRQWQTTFQPNKTWCDKGCKSVHVPGIVLHDTTIFGILCSFVTGIPEYVLITSFVLQHVLFISREIQSTCNEWIVLVLYWCE